MGRRDRCIQPCRVALAGVALLLSLASAARADTDFDREEPIEITADHVTYDARSRVYLAEGSVRVVQRDSRIDSEWMVFNRATRRGIAAGDVRLDDGTRVLDARFIEFDDGGQQGLIVAGRFDMGENDFRMAAAEIWKTGEDTYEARDASFSTCRCPEDDDRLPWQLNAAHADVEIGDYATATNVSTDILGVPALWIPWMMFPVKTERASGILLPELGYGSHHGFEVGLPIFWAARHDVGVIATPRYLSKRGFKPELEIETVYGAKSETEIFGSYLRDQETVTYIDGTSGPPRRRNLYSKNRWGVGVYNDVHLPADVRVRSDVQVVSDNAYVSDFSEFREHDRDRFLESRVFGFGHFGPSDSGALVAGALYADDRQNPDINDRDKFLIQRPADATLAWLPTPIPGAAGLSLELDADYTYFRQWERAESELRLSSAQIVGDDLFADIGIAADPAFTSAPGIGDGVFEEGEPLNDRGHRAILHPHLSHSLRLFDAVELLPEVGWQQTLYSTRGQGYAERGLLTARLDVATQVLGELDLPGLPAMIHRLEPRVGGAFVSDVGQTRKPLFVPPTAVPQERLRQLSLDNVVRDSSDRVDEARIVRVGLGNRFFAPGADGPQLRAELELSAGYDFTGSGVGEFQQVIADGAVFPGAGVQADFNLAYDVEEEDVAQALFDLSVPTPRWAFFESGSYVSAGYRYRRDIPLFFENFQIGEDFKEFEAVFERIHQVTGSTRLRLTERWAVEYQFGYSFEQSLMLRNRGALEYTSGCRCWAFKVGIEDDRTRGIQATVNFTILGFGQDLANPFRGGGLLGSDIY